jgi:hypothetical protein
MTLVLHSPITAIIGLLAFNAWVAMLFIMFWPRRRDALQTRRDKNDDHL